jgi:hypothetical protein
MHEKIRAELADLKDAEVDISPNMAGFREKIAAETATIGDIAIKVDADPALFREKIVALKAELAAAQAAKLKIELDDAVARAELTRLEADLERLKAQPSSVKVDADIAEAEARIDELKARLDALRDAHVSVNIDTAAAMAKIAELEVALTALGARSPNIKVNVDTNSATTALKTLGTAFTDVGSKGSLMGVSIGAAIIPAITSATQLTGVLGLIPAIALGAGLGLGAVAIGVQGMSEALKGSGTAADAAAKATQADATANQAVAAAVGGSAAAHKTATQAVTAAAAAHKSAQKAADDYAASLKNLAPAAQQVVSAIIQLKPAFDALKMDVQQQLFQGVGAAMLNMGTTVLPVLRSGLTQVASAINEAVLNFAKFATSKAAIADYQAIFNNIGTAAHSLAGAVQPILQIFTDVARVGSQFLPGLATSFTSAAQAAAAFVSNARQTGQLAQWIQTGLNAVKELWGAFKDVVAIIKDLAAAPGFGPNFLQALHDVTTAIRWVIENVPGATTAVQLFFDAWLFAKLVTGAAGMVSKIGEVIGLLGKLRTAWLGVTVAEEATTVAAVAAGDAGAAAGVKSEAAALKAGVAWKALGAAIKLAAAAGLAFAAGEGLKALGKDQPDSDALKKASTLDKFRDSMSTAGKGLTGDFSGFGAGLKREAGATDIDNSPLVNFWKQADKLTKDGFAQLGQAFKTGFQTLTQSMDSFGQSGIQSIQKVLDKAKEWTGKKWEAIISAKDSAGGIIQTVVSKAKEWAGKAWDAVVSAKDSAVSIVQKVLDKATEWAGRAWNAVVGAIDTASGAIQSVIGAVGGWVGRAWDAVVSATDTASGVIRSVISTVGGWIGRAWDAVVSATDSASSVIQTIIGKAGEYVGRAWSATIGALDNASGVIQGILASLQSIVSRTWTAVVNTVTGGASGMIVAPMATGGVVEMAAGGKLTPMSASMAQIVPPNTWRVIGDRMKGMEAFIPINQSAMSQAILAKTAELMGQMLIPRKLLPLLKMLSPILGLAQGRILATDDSGAALGYATEPDAPTSNYGPSGRRRGADGFDGSNLWGLLRRLFSQFVAPALSGAGGQQQLAGLLQQQAASFTAAIQTVAPQGQQLGHWGSRRPGTGIGTTAGPSTTAALPPGYDRAYTGEMANSPRPDPSWMYQQSRDRTREQSVFHIYPRADQNEESIALMVDRRQAFALRS